MQLGVEEQTVARLHAVGEIVPTHRAGAGVREPQGGRAGRHREVAVDLPVGSAMAGGEPRASAAGRGLFAGHLVGGDPTAIVIDYLQPKREQLPVPIASMPWFRSLVV